MGGDVGAEGAAGGNMERINKICWLGTSLAVHWLRLCTFNAGGRVLIPGWGTKIPHALWHGQKINK